MLHTKRALTLIEILMVIVVLGILVAIVAPQIIDSGAPRLGWSGAKVRAKIYEIVTEGENAPYAVTMEYARVNPDASFQAVIIPLQEDAPTWLGKTYQELELHDVVFIEGRIEWNGRIIPDTVHFE